MRKPVKRQRLVLCAAALCAIALAGCVDSEQPGTFGSETSTRKQAVTVVPEFVITGVDAIPKSLFVTDLGLTVSEIRLEPMWSTDSLAYSTREPIVVGFDIANGEAARTTAPLELPAGGRYLVSIRLEPIASNEGADPASFSLYGFLDDDGVKAELGDPEVEGRPQPMPFNKSQDGELIDQQAYPREWTPFEYNSKRAVFYTFNDVVFEPGAQFLTFSFDVRDWAVDVMEPISNAVRSSGAWDDSVDVTNQIDSSGNGVEALIRTGVVRSDNRPR